MTFATPPDSELEPQARPATPADGARPAPRRAARGRVQAWSGAWSSGSPQAYGAPPHWLAAAVQLVGTVLFNVNTIDAALTLHARPDLQNEAVWVPDTTGSIAFLVSSVLAFAPEVRAKRHSHVLANSWWIAAINLAGSVLFGVSAAAAYVLRNGHDVSLHGVDDSPLLVQPG